MSKRLVLSRPLGSRSSAMSLAAIAALVLIVALPTPVLAWDSYSFSGTEEDKLVTLINQYRAAKGVPALKVDSTLHSVAEWRSKDMYDRNYFSHCDPSVTTCGSGKFQFTKKLQALGYCYAYAGENIAWNNYPDQQSGDTPGTTQKAFDGWKSSAAHNAIMLDANFTRIGIGVFKGDGRWAGRGGAYNAESTAYPAKVFTAVFTRPCASATPTPSPTPKPAATATPKPTPIPTARPTATPKPTATTTSKPAPTATPRPPASFKVTPDPTATAAPPPQPTAEGVTPGPSSTPEATPGPTPEPSPEPSQTIVLPSPGALQVMVPLPSLDLLGAVVGGVAGVFFGD